MTPPLFSSYFPPFLDYISILLDIVCLRHLLFLFSWCFMLFFFRTYIIITYPPACRLPPLSLLSINLVSRIANFIFVCCVANINQSSLGYMKKWKKNFFFTLPGFFSRCLLNLLACLLLPFSILGRGSGKIIINLTMMNEMKKKNV